MGIFDRLMNNMGEIDPSKVSKLVDRMLLDGEEVSHSFQATRDYLIFTNHRMIIIDIQGMTGNKKEYMSIHYGDISRYSMESAGTVDADAELDIYIGAAATPTAAISFGRNSTDTLFKCYRLVAEYKIKN